MIPFLQELANAKRVLIAGCGGGFDVFAGVPIAQQLISAGKHVTFASFSLGNMSYAAELAETEGIEDARRAIERRREALDVRPRRELPL
jgi:hypothetical protein